MIKNNVYYELFASIQVPNSEQVGYWVDLGADPHGNIIKFFDKNINKWVKLTDANSEYAVAPYIGNNGNWFIENRDSGIPAAGKNPYIGDNSDWFVFVPLENKYVDTGIVAKGLSAYEIAVRHGFKGTEEEWLDYIRQPAKDAALEALNAKSQVEATETEIKEAEALRVIEFNGMKDVLEEVTLYAEEQANYAKQEGDKAAGLNDDVRYLEENKLEGLAVENDLLYGVIGGELVGEGISMPSGGGGGGGGGAVGSTLRVKNLSGTSIVTAVGQEVIIRYSFSSVDSEDGTPTGDGTVEYIVNSIKVAADTIAQGDVSKNITAYLVRGINSIRVTVTDSYGASRSLNIKVEIVDVSVTSTFDASQPITGEFVFRYTPIGSMEKVIHFLVDGVEIATNTTILTLRELSQVIPAQTHGSHMLEVYATASVGGVNIESEHLFYDLICVTEGNNTPIIASPFHTEKVQQFDTINIPFYVYSPSLLRSEISLFVNGILVGSRTVDRTQQVWAYRTSEAEKLVMEIKCGSVVKTFNVDVLELSIDIEAETQDLELYLTSHNRSNSDANREEWSYGNIASSLSGFNWKTNGWILDDSGYSCLRVGGGANVTVPLNIFGEDFRTTGKTIEFEFLVRDVYNYNTPLITCWSGDRGIIITAQDALMKSEQSEMSTVFKDGERIRISFVIQKRILDRLINIYINGINSQSIQYPSSDNFEQSTPVGITIGGPDATVDIYTIRCYNNSLSRYQLLNNYIADMDDVGYKLEVYGRNKIYDDYGAIDINVLNNYIPIMTIIGDLPQYKGDKKIVKVSYTDLAKPEKSFTAENVQIDVQGTSSQYYPRKNYKLKFKSGFTMTTNGSHADAYTLSDKDCLPATVFCTKADFAESSGTHNTGIANYADWLLHQMGILTEPQEIDPLVRTTIYGEPCCIAHRPTVNDESEFIGKYNFNTDKAAEETFGFEPGDESWEFRNNTSDRVLFKVSDYGPGWTDDFEARYPEDSLDFARLKEITDWIVSCGTDVEKFKAELPQYMDKTQVVFYWLFTLIFGMVDQRAKNMFLTIYKGGLWLFILYDNDTCLGINNEGAISFKYDIEIHDMLESKDVWNGADSALWNLVERAYPDEIQSMYYTMRQQNHLTYDKVIEFLNTRQSDKWSEAIYNEDGFFKYEKPLVDGYLDYSQSITNPQLIKTGAYLYALQGSREMHRKWWVANRLNYLDSKFLAGAILSDTAVFRTYTPSSWEGVEPCADITLTAFSAMYLNVKWGSAMRSKRVDFNETFKMTAPEGMSFNDTETIIYGASQISSLGDLSPLYVGSVDVSKMTKLKELIIGSKVSGYKNHNLRTLSIGENKLLKKLDVRNCPEYSEPIDVHNCINIEEIYAQGTSITAVNLPDGGNLSRLYLPDTITNLSLKNQSKLSDAYFEIAGIKNLSTIVCENTPGVNVFPIVDQCMSMQNPVLSRIRLIGINSTNANLDTLYKLIKLGGVDENGNNIPNAVVTGKFHAITAVENKLAAIRKAFPELTVTYTNLKPPVITTFVFKSSQSKSITNSTLECNYEFEKVSGTTYKITAENDSIIEFTFRCDNHKDYSGSYLVYNTRTQEYTVTYIPLRKIRVQVYGQSIYVANARVTIGEDVYITDANGYATLKRGGEAVSGTVTAAGYSGNTFSFNAIDLDETHTVYVYANVEITFVVKNGVNDLVQGATVTCDGKSAITNIYGECVLLLSKGEYEYIVSHPDYIDRSSTVSVSTVPSRVTAYTSIAVIFLVKDQYDNYIQGATIKLNNKEFTTDEFGECTMMINPPDTYEYSVTAVGYIETTGAGSLQINYNKTETVVLKIDFFYLKPEENGNIQMLVRMISDKSSVYITPGNSTPIIYWGDGETTQVQPSDKNTVYKHVYPDKNIYQLEIESKPEIVDASMGTMQDLLAYWSIGDSKIKVPDLREHSSLVYVGDIFKNAADITNLNEKFRYCSALEFVDLSSLINSTKVVNLYGMFELCQSLTTVDLSPLKNMTGVTDLHNMFYGCTRLKSVDLSPLAGMTKCTNLSSMFYGCTNLESIDLTPLKNMTGVTDLRYMFEGCNVLKSIDLSSLSGMVLNTDLRGMFNSCKSLETIDLTPFVNMTKVISVEMLFYECEKLKSIDISPLSNVFKNNASVAGMFRGCVSLQSIDLTPLAGITESISISQLFYGCVSLQSIDLTPLSNVAIFSTDYTFYNCISLQSIKGESLENSTPNIVNRYTFYGCRELQKIHLFSNADTIGDSCYRNCENLKYAITSKNIPPTISTTTFLKNTCTFYVPDESVEAYKTATNWSAYADRIKPISDFATDFPEEVLE